MFDSALIAGIAITLSALAIFAIIALLVLRRQGRYAHGRTQGKQVPPPVDPGDAQPEQAKDLNGDDKPPRGLAG